MTVVNSLKAAIERLAGEPADEVAWRFLYRQMWPFILTVVYRRLKDKAAAEDAAQEVLLRILRSRPFDKIHEESAFRAYVWKMAINVANTYSRNVARKHKLEHDLFERQTVQADAIEQLSEEHDRFLMEEALWLLIEQLEREDSELLKMLLHSKTLGEAAAALDMSYSNAGVRYYWLKQKLRKLLKEKEK